MTTTPNKDEAPKSTRPSKRDDNLDDLGRDVNTGKVREEQHPQQELEIGKRKRDDG
jgi:hypothetical protein